MKCPSCASDAPAGSAFCPKCGKSMATTSEPASPFAPAAGVTSEPQRVGVAGEFSPTIWEGSYSWKAMVGSWIGAGALTIVLLVAAFFVQDYFKDHKLYVWLGAGG